jgi:sec-independent protein translocase protein TatB
MSLPDTVFIFVLALIIFGPKKLPEIGRQLGKLVGEFRRASNEFKFQIEEELRQADLADRNTIAPAKKELETSASSEASAETPDFNRPDLPDSEEPLPVGQYPNIDTVDPEDLTPVESTETEAAQVLPHEQAEVEHETSELAIHPAVGAEPRTTPPHSASPPTPEPESSAATESGESNATALPSHERSDSYAAPAVADVTHG